MSAYPIEYGSVDGALVRPDLAGRQLPAPPEWVRNRVVTPERTKFACLSKEIAHLYPPHVRDVLVKYVVQWPVVKQSGIDLVIAGRVPTRRLRWAGAAVVNEVVMRYGSSSAISTYWFAPGNLSWLVDARSSRADEYAPIRNRILKTKLLFIENPLAIGKDSEGMWFMRALYQHRYDNRLPTITSLSTDVREDWNEVKRVLGADIVDHLRENNHGYIAHY